MFGKDLTERNEETTPLESIIRRFDQINFDDDSRQPVILISTGSYNPAHRVHIEIFEMIRKGLEEKYNMNILGSFISPSSYAYYVKNKLGAKAMNDEVRSEIIRRSISEAKLSDFLFLETWEMKQDGFVDYPEVVETFTEYIQSKISERVRVIYVCGLDHLRRCGCYSLRREGKGVACLKRFGYKTNENILNDKNVFLIDGFLDFDMSSTAVRKLIEEKEFKGLEKYMFPSAIEYLKNYYLSKK